MTALINPYFVAPAIPTDPSFANVVLLCHFDGTNGATTFTDNSAAAHSVTGSAGAQLTTAQKQWGTASLDVTTATSVAASANSADWNFGSGQFTVEAWVRETTSHGGSLAAIVNHWAVSSPLEWWFGFSSNSLSFFYSTTGTGNVVVSGVFALTLNTWTHLAVDRNAANLVRVYANGAVIGSGTVPALFASTEQLRIGNDATLGRRWIGQIDDLRITKGVARYDGVFTPPAAPFPDA